MALLYFFAKENSPGLNEMWDLLDEHQERDAALIRNIAASPRAEGPTACFVVTQATMKTIGDPQTVRDLQMKRGLVYFEADSLAKDLKDAFAQQVLSHARISVSAYTELSNIVRDVADARVESVCMFEDLVNG